ncbi:precorrin-2 C(20)-methyltransferase [Alicyclobacillus contaminans]|uniref:precorrin-2 C(20)-methyltransferase n=1 Tax=Alicyclobacillus contaminans TaxID=392016 RepID=UPI00047C42F9|nr:precorrin-2 C(20)-methyltransferase [Alicyclobacillus contaminans]GMA48767.1 precorrin-2 C(20)-methyltransferase [Alicyclobacillus contaminans]
MTSTCGTLYGIGVGPGDPELITVKAYRLLQTCPVIAYPRKRSGSRSYAADIVEQYVDRQTKTMLGLVFPMTRDETVLEQYWNTTVQSLWEHLRQGRDVAFVTEGDPLLYSTFIHVLRQMQAQHPEVPVVSVPGVSSVNAAANRLGLPLADGDEWVAIVPATDDRDAMRDALLRNDCVVFLKVAKVLSTILQLLEELDMVDGAFVCSHVTSARERIWRNVREVAQAELPYLTLMVVKR